ncbi:MmcQ/YjbR family DNA-binding protein [Paenibacillus hexagrammi]|uniref:MmcQ/YjbR family DNA-binding protein n=1 Tax=Paenibacillus hexagrammi TaxID=2908839 RepID=A0ABY3SJW8_9BACL|nr:MmcQ/YjbR family DNA-binding protein [Paenibacillus sp. YPD9-1]UJF33534.1 MmcQ/YjbR family DNA-binding protein [Paenibacillus sp. YPD9-1]
MQSKQGLDMLERVRRIVETLPETEELIDGFGHTVMKVKGKTFVMMGENDGTPGLSFKSDKETQFLLLHQSGYVKTPYIGHHGWVSIDKGSNPNWDELTGHIKEAYLLAAPKRLAQQVLKGGKGIGIDDTEQA